MWAVKENTCECGLKIPTMITMLIMTVSMAITCNI